MEKPLAYYLRAKSYDSGCMQVRSNGSAETAVAFCLVTFDFNFLPGRVSEAFPSSTTLNKGSKLLN